MMAGYRNMKRSFALGIENLLGKHRQWLKDKRVGLVSHLAAVDSDGCTTAERLHLDPAVRLVALFGPEHGFFGTAGAGESCATRIHPDLRIPIHSLYGKTRKPTRSMLKNVDALVIDLSDIAVRAYTYVATLRNVLEVASDLHKEVIVADRPVPMPNTVDGPVALDPYVSFVSTEGLPLAYGMTPGETALWLKRTVGLSLELRVSAMTGYIRHSGSAAVLSPWIPPSPAIVSLESAKCYPATVLFEAIESVDHGRRTNFPFQVFGSSAMDGARIARALSKINLPGVTVHAHRYLVRSSAKHPTPVHGVRITVVDADRFKPARTAVSIIYTLQSLYGISCLWAPKQTRPDFFDLLCGTGEVRRALLDGAKPATIAASWQRDLALFRKDRRKALLYPKK